MSSNPMEQQAETAGDIDSGRTPIVALLVVLTLAIVWNLVGNLVLPGAWYVPANLGVAALALVVASRAGLDRRELGIDRADATRGLVIGVIVVAAVAVALAVALAIPATEALLEDPNVAGDSVAIRWFTPLVRIPLGTALYEELLFRSALFGLIGRIRSASHALVATSVLFGLWHVVPAWETASGGAASVAAAIVGTVLVTTLAGVGFGLLRMWSHSVIAPVLAHTATNSLAYAAALVALFVIE